ncbi:hypothetical protein [Streptomyces oceani]|uniref:Uncharacterized protein n=1 Tax=Streptomyces oceani TaxID=1075402 RepID=A0A1E7JWH1_9ACTN|nr:hypothetical protein [Streptomyces oceani]OEU95976.1 hypothetical protein AN216_22885 [Streptomyces oceani]
MASRSYLYHEPTGNPFDKPVRLCAEHLRIGRQRVPLGELNLPAMADAYLRGSWLGGAGSEQPLWHVEMARAVPVTRISGSTFLVRPLQPAVFAQELGELAVRASGGPETVAWHAQRAAEEEVPLWIARRWAHGPHGLVSVAVDRLSQRVDVWAVDTSAPTEPETPAAAVPVSSSESPARPNSPVSPDSSVSPGPPASPHPSASPVRIRAPYGLVTGSADPARGLRLTIGPDSVDLDIADLVPRLDQQSIASTLTVRTPHHEWLLRKAGWRSSELLRDTHPIATIRKPGRRRAPEPLLALATVEYGDCDPQDVLLIHALAVAFRLGRFTGGVRLAPQNRLRDTTRDVWGQPWWTGVGSCPGDSGLGAAHDEWGGLFDTDLDGSGGGGGGFSGGAGGGDGGGGGGM